MNRTEAICKALGYQGGTIHQLAAETGVSVEDLLYGVPSATYLSSDYSQGWAAGRTCSVDFNRTVNFPAHFGNKDFWLGVAMGLIAQG
jgi:hypothetical protein